MAERRGVATGPYRRRASALPDGNLLVRIWGGPGWETGRGYPTSLTHQECISCGRSFTVGDSATGFSRFFETDVQQPAWRTMAHDKLETLPTNPTRPGALRFSVDQRERRQGRRGTALVISHQLAVKSAALSLTPPASVQNNRVFIRPHTGSKWE